jgi:YbbR domain-containing protein
MGVLRRYVFHDIGLKLFALLMAVCLWAVVTQDHREERQLPAAIELHNMPQNLEISSVSLPEARLWLSGPSRVMDHLGSNSVHVILDLSGAQPGERTYSLDSRDVRLPDGVRVTQIAPAQVQLHLDVRERRSVQVRPRVVGRLASGFAITSVTADPAQITVVGPARRVNMVDAAVTDPVDATGLLSQRSFMTNAYVSDPLVQVVNPEPVRVTVFVGKSSRSRD